MRRTYSIYLAHGQGTLTSLKWCSSIINGYWYSPNHVAKYVYQKYEMVVIHFQRIRKNLLVRNTSFLILSEKLPLRIPTAVGLGNTMRLIFTKNHLRSSSSIYFLSRLWLCFKTKKQECFLEVLEALIYRSTSGRNALW